jgi:hypothetical protein
MYRRITLPNTEGFLNGSRLLTSRDELIAYGPLLSCARRRLAGHGGAGPSPDPDLGGRPSLVRGAR